jgi:transcription initiation factor TFIIA small subunit
MALIDTLDEMVHTGGIEPQTAMKVMTAFDKSITEVLADKVKARMNFKV